MWYYRLQQRLALTTIELRVLVALLAFFFAGLAVQQWPQALPYDESTYAADAEAFAEAAPDLSAGALSDTGTATFSDSASATPVAPALPSAEEQVHLNTADAAALQRLPGIGPALAERIMAYRAAHGPFARVSDITRVSGIGPRTLERLAPKATVD
ncbi:MAG: hypothetical protein GVY15_07525 [Bacteroidetes bacterium]|jgi:competence protein ComEA|nr:hypothetical protein [Bacteroidota bacterium]